MPQESPAAERNKGPLLDVLRRLLPRAGTVLEIASGTGQHAAWFASHLPALVFQPSDPSADARATIAERRAEAALPNLLAPLDLDVTRAGWTLPGPAGRPDAILCINMIHIAPWTASEGLFGGARERLGAGSKLVLYGPYRFGGQFTAPSNAAFDASLRARDPAWGVRDLDDVTALAALSGFAREEVIDMPANNHVVVFARQL